MSTQLENIQPGATDGRGGRGLLLAAACVIFSGCGGGGEDVSLGSGQGPDPATVDFPIAYVKRSLPAPPMTLADDSRSLRTFNVDADLYIRDRAAPSVPERNITQRVTGDTELWDVKDLEASYDANLVLFAMRGPIDPDADEEDLPKWGIWEYNRITDVLRRVIPSDTVADAGHDVSPHYLPDGRIVFSSTRQRQSQAVLLDEGKPQFPALDEQRNEPGFVLHVMNADGSDIHQISFNQSHDRDASVLLNGQVVYTRWDRAFGATSAQSLYRMNPDGTGLELYYGAESHATGFQNQVIQFLQPRVLQNGRVAVIARPFTGSEFGGDVLSIDAETYVENTQPLLPNRGVLTGPAQSRLVANDVRILPGTPSPGGVFADAFPLHDGTNRMFVSWSMCRLIEDSRIVPCTEDRLDDPDAVPAPVLYGLWMYDIATGTQLPVIAPVEGQMFAEVITLMPRVLPPVILDKVPGVDLDATLVGENVGVLDIRSVYDIDGIDTANPDIATLADPAQRTANQRPQRFLRIVKAVSIPDDDVRDFRQSAFGASPYMREIIGYAPVEPDGSVRVKVPANVALAIDVVDVNVRRTLSRHSNWLQVRPGEVVRCNGCHDPDPDNLQSHGRANLFASANAGAPTTGLPFPNTDPALFADFGETMAQTRARHSCSSDNCRSMNPTTDVVYEDVWTHQPTAGRAPDASFTYRYSSLSTPAPLSNPDCATQWTAQCRIVINYETIIHPLWSTPRITLAADGVTVLSDNTCTRCHSTRDAANTLRVPAGQLDLADGPSPDNPDRFNAYHELVFIDNRQTLNMATNTLEDECAQFDPVTGVCVQFFTVLPSVRSAGALGSRFFQKMDNNVGTVNHRGFLNNAEVRLMAEWMDIGAQYYNDPFAAPLN
jgi:hypothetical protein